MGLEEVTEIVAEMLEKLKELALVSMESLGGEAITRFEKVFPAETRSEKMNHWFQIAKPYLIGYVFLMVVLFLCRCCCGGGRGKTMKAPGRNHRMSRNEFERDPKGYFGNLRARRPSK